AARPEIVKDAPGDPKVGVVGGSYGGGLALMLAGYDQRGDAIVPMITWNDLAKSFLPEATGKDPAQGVFKRQWAGLFFGRGSTAGSGADDLSALLGSGAQIPSGVDPGSLGAALGRGAGDPQCGRFARDVCDIYLKIASTGVVDDAAVARLRQSSPSSVINKIKAPALLIQGQADSLFPLS